MDKDQLCRPESAVSSNICSMRVIGGRSPVIGLAAFRRAVKALEEVPFESELYDVADATRSFIRRCIPELHVPAQPYGQRPNDSRSAPDRLRN